MAALYFSLALSSLRHKSVTTDEFAHLPVGYNVLTTGDFRFCEYNPPLLNVLTAVPLLLMDLVPAETPRPLPDNVRYSFWPNGYDFMHKYARDYHGVFTAARSVTVGLVGLLGLLLFVWGRVLAPQRPNLAGLAAAALLWFSPGVLADARLVTTDAGAAAFTTLAAWSWYLYLRRPRRHFMILAGVTLGLAQLTKFNAVLLFPIFLLAALVWTWRHKQPALGTTLVGVAVAFAVSMVTINAGYLFQGSGRSLGKYELASGPGQFVQRVLPHGTPVPLPESYVLAFDRQLHDSAIGDPAYLFGTPYHGGKWYFFAALIAVKTPVAVLLLGLLAVACAAFRRGLSVCQNVFLLLPFVVFLLAFSFFSNKQFGLRMLLPTMPLVFLWMSATLAAGPWNRWVFGGAAALLVWLPVETLRIHPDYLAYFNHLAGGPSQGTRYADGSSLDWGQDLWKLKRYMDEQDIDSIQLLYFGRVDPAIYGIRYEVPLRGLHAGWLAIGTTLLTRSYYLYDHGELYQGGPFQFNEDLLGEPVATIGHSIRVYHLGRGP